MLIPNKKNVITFLLLIFNFFPSTVFAESAIKIVQIQPKDLATNRFYIKVNIPKNSKEIINEKANDGEELKFTIPPKADRGKYFKSNFDYDNTNRNANFWQENKLNSFLRFFFFLNIRFS
jgi:hypothetical protein